MILAMADRSYALHELKRTPEARDNLLRVVDRFPKSATMRYNLACYECQLDCLDLPQSWLKKAFEFGGRQETEAGGPGRSRPRSTVVGDWQPMRWRWTVINRPISTRPQPAVARIGFFVIA
jgi:hypothetical protein